jgi:hypothetical protein
MPQMKSCTEFIFKFEPKIFLNQRISQPTWGFDLLTSLSSIFYIKLKCYYNNLPNIFSDSAQSSFHYSVLSSCSNWKLRCLHLTVSPSYCFLYHTLTPYFSVSSTLTFWLLPFSYSHFLLQCPFLSYSLIAYFLLLSLLTSLSLTLSLLSFFYSPVAYFLLLALLTSLSLPLLLCGCLLSLTLTPCLTASSCLTLWLLLTFSYFYTPYFTVSSSLTPYSMWMCIRLMI